MQIRRWGSETLVNTTTPGNKLSPRVVALANGRLLVAWHSVEDSSIRGQILDARGTPVGNELTLRAPDAGTVPEFDVTGLADGGFYLVWNQTVGTVSYILGRVFTPAGALLREQPVLYSLARESGVQVSRLGSGAVVAWNTQGTQTVNRRIFNGAGVGGAITSDNVSAPSWTLSVEAVAPSPDGTRFVAVESYYDTHSYETRAVAFDATGDYAGFSLGMFRSSSLFNSARNPVVAWISNTDFVVAWHRTLPEQYGNFADVEMRIMTTRGFDRWMLPVTDVIRVNGSLAGNQWFPQVAAMPGGRFVVAWRDLTAESAGDTVRMQVFDAGGNRLGGEAIVSGSAETLNTSFRIAALADGRVAVTWNATDADGATSGGHSVFMQIVDPRDGHVMGTSADDTLYGHDSVADEISGYGGDDTLYGLRGDDTLWGGTGHDTLDGGRGADDMHGGPGNDTYILDNIEDAVFELARQGSDTIRTGAISIDLALYPFVEHVALTGALPLSARGTAGTNTLDGEGNGAANVLTGLGGIDTYIVGAGDTVVEAAGAGMDAVQSRTISLNLAAYPGVENIILAGALPLSATGNAGANGIDGASNSAANVLSGLGGDDIYYVGAGDTIVEAAGGGTDTVVSNTLALNLAQYPGVENATLGGIEGLSATGTAGANVLDGSQNVMANVLIGLGGNDTYIVDSIDAVVEAPGGGTDKVESALIHIDLALYPNTEWLLLRGGLPLTGYGTGGADILDGSFNSAANVLVGRGGDDSYVLGAGDSVVEAPGGGTDRVQAWAISLDLSLHPNVENATLTGAVALNLTGSAGANVLTGNAGANTLTGNGGGDTFVGLGGLDTLVGGSGADRFRFLAPSDSAVGANRDVIQGFSAAGGDRIDVAAIDANGALAGDPAFVFRGTAAFTGAGQLRYDVAGADVILQGKIAGGAAAFEIRVAGVNALAAGDFLL
jgi:Ca2+-binding RTX toxin-like protein